MPLLIGYLKIPSPHNQLALSAWLYTWGEPWWALTAVDYCMLCGWIGHECFMREEELTLNSSCSLGCDSSSIWDLVNPLYIVNFLLFLPGHLACAFE